MSTCSTPARTFGTRSHSWNAVVFLTCVVSSPVDVVEDGAGKVAPCQFPKVTIVETMLQAHSALRLTNESCKPTHPSTTHLSRTLNDESRLRGSFSSSGRVNAIGYSP